MLRFSKALVARDKSNTPLHIAMTAVDRAAREASATPALLEVGTDLAAQAAAPLAASAANDGGPGVHGPASAIMDEARAVIAAAGEDGLLEDVVAKLDRLASGAAAREAEARAATERAAAAEKARDEAVSAREAAERALAEALHAKAGLEAEATARDAELRELRNLMASLMKTMEEERRRRTEALARIGQRLGTVDPGTPRPPLGLVQQA